MPNWLCPKCNTENRPEGIYCRACGEKSPDLRESQTSSASSGAAGGSARRQSKSILNEIRGEMGSPFKKSRSSLDQFTAGLPNLSDMGVEVPDLDALLGNSATSAPRVTTHSLQLKFSSSRSLNYALAHCDMPLIYILEIDNASYEDAEDVLIKAWIATDYGEPWQKTVAVIPAQKRLVEKEIILPLSKSRLQEVREAEKASLRLDVFIGGTLQISKTSPMEVLAYNEWYYSKHMGGITACFVQPNTDAVEKIISMVRDRLRREYKDTALDGYQSGDPKKVVQMLEALYLTLQKDLQLSYINPPPSFEHGQVFEDGSFSISQKVFFPEQIVKHRRGTCLDLALLCAACVERMGLHPMCFLIRGHAFYGVWLAEMTADNWMVQDYAELASYLSKGLLLPLNSTTFALTPPKSFKDCQQEALYCLSDPDRFLCAVDVVGARAAGYKPIPPMTTGPSTVQDGPGLGGGYGR